MSSGLQINNSYQIEEEFKSEEIRRTFYHPPKKVKQPRHYFRSGQPKIFTEEEIMLFKMKNYKKEGGN